MNNFIFILTEMELGKDMLLEIFNYLDFVDLARMRRVSKFWQQLINDQYSRDYKLSISLISDDHAKITIHRQDQTSEFITKYWSMPLNPNFSERYRTDINLMMKAYLTRMLNHLNNRIYRSEREIRSVSHGFKEYERIFIADDMFVFETGDLIADKKMKFNYSDLIKSSQKLPIINNQISIVQLLVVMFNLCNKDK